MRQCSSVVLCGLVWKKLCPRWVPAAACDRCVGSSLFLAGSLSPHPALHRSDCVSPPPPPLHFLHTLALSRTRTLMHAHLCVVRYMVPHAQKEPADTRRVLLGKLQVARRALELIQADDLDIDF